MGSGNVEGGGDRGGKGGGEIEGGEKLQRGVRDLARTGLWLFFILKELQQI
jgi:hypothetical protein